MTNSKEKHWIFACRQNCFDGNMQCLTHSPGHLTCLFTSCKEITFKCILYSKHFEGENPAFFHGQLELQFVQYKSM